MEYSYSPGYNPYSLSFDGVDDYVEVADSAVLSPAAITIECWIKWDGVRYITPKDFMAVISKGNFGTGEFTLLITRNSANNTNSLNLYANGATRATVSLGTLNTEWNHVAATYDGVIARLFFDGIQLKETVTSFTIPDTSNPLRIGRQANDLYPFGGLIDDVRIWNIARTQPQIQANMNRQFNGNGPGLVGYWKFDEGSGATATDSARGNNGTINGASWTSITPTFVSAIDVKTDWLLTDSINADDFNRIESNIRTCREYLIGLQYAIPAITSVLSRDQTYIDYLSSIDRIEQNLETIRMNFLTPSGYPGAETWTLGKGFDYTDANRLETDIKLLMDLGLLVFNSFVYCGTINCGQARGKLSGIL